MKAPCLMSNCLTIILVIGLSVIFSGFLSRFLKCCSRSFTLSCWLAAFRFALAVLFLLLTSFNVLLLRSLVQNKYSYMFNERVNKMLNLAAAITILNGRKSNNSWVTPWTEYQMKIIFIIYIHITAFKRVIITWDGDIIYFLRPQYDLTQCARLNSDECCWNLCGPTIFCDQQQLHE